MIYTLSDQKQKPIILFLAVNPVHIKQIKYILSAVKKYRIFSLVTDTILVVHCSKQRLFQQFWA